MVGTCITFNDILVCQRLLWELGILKFSGFKIEQEGVFSFPDYSELKKNFKNVAELRDFKNPGLLIFVFSARDLKRRILDFCFQKEKIKMIDFSFLLDTSIETNMGHPTIIRASNNENIENEKKKKNNNDLYVEKQEIERAMNIYGSIPDDSLMTERLAFIGEAFLDLVITDYLRGEIALDDISNTFFFY